MSNHLFLIRPIPEPVPRLLLPQADLYSRGYRFRVGGPRKRGRRDGLDDDGPPAREVGTGRSGTIRGTVRAPGRGPGRPRLGVAGGGDVLARGSGSAGGGGMSGGTSGGIALDAGDRGESAWSGDVEVRLAFTGRRFMRLRLDNCPAGVSVPPASAPSAATRAAESGAAVTYAAAASDTLGQTASEPSDAVKAKIHTETETHSTESSVVMAGAQAPKRGPEKDPSPVVVQASSGGGRVVSGNGGGRGARRKVFMPTPLVGPKPALARGGWASLAVATAAATRIPGDHPDSGEGGDNDEPNGNDDIGPMEAGAGTWVNHPLSVLECLRELLLRRATVMASSSTTATTAASMASGKANGSGAIMVAADPKEDVAAMPRGHSALVELLDSGFDSTVASNDTKDGGEDYAACLRKGPLEQLAGKMRLLLRADRDRAGVGIGEEGLKIGLAEFISLVEDVHRSVERTTRQR